MEQKQTAKPGRPSKGERRKTTLRLPMTLAAAAENYIKQHGGNLNDLMIELLTAKVDPKSAQPQQEALRLSA